MILDGKCGTFNPLLLQCMRQNADRLKELVANKKLKQEQEKVEEWEMKNNYGGVLSEIKQTISIEEPEYMRLLYVDPLTEIYNRRYYKEYIQDILYVEAIVIIDVANLGCINNDYGQDVGDLVLQETAQALAGMIRRNDYLIRYGSDEFLIVFNNMNKSVFKARLEEIRQGFDALRLDGYPELRVSANIGGVYGTGKPEELFHMADKMLNEAKYTEKQIRVSFLDRTGDSV